MTLHRTAPPREAIKPCAKPYKSPVIPQANRTSATYRTPTRTPPHRTAPHQPDRAQRRNIEIHQPTATETASQQIPTSPD